MLKTGYVALISFSHVSIPARSPWLTISQLHGAKQHIRDQHELHRTNGKPRKDPGSTANDGGAEITHPSLYL